MTNGFFGTNLKEFTGLSSGTGAYSNSWILTLPELFSRAFGQGGGMHSSWQGGVPAAIKTNLKKGAVPMVMQLIAIPIIFKTANKMLGKTLIRPANRLLAPAGVKI